MPKKYALLIGQRDYEDKSLARLSAPWDDVSKLGEVLAEFGDFEVNPQVDLDGNRAREVIQEHFQRAGPDDTVLFYYTGHGLRDIDDPDLYLALRHTKTRLLRGTALKAGYIRDEMRHSPSKRQILIFDCCHSGAVMGPGAKRAADDTTLNKSDVLDPGGVGQYVLTASAANESAFERDGKSIYTEFMVEALKTGAAAPEDDVVTVDALHNYLVNRVGSDKDNLPMRPHIWKSGVHMPLVIARNPDPRKPVPPDLVSGLYDTDTLRARGAIAELLRLRAGPDARLRGDIDAELQRRLNKTDDLLAVVADSIRQGLGIGQPGKDAERDSQLAAQAEALDEARRQLEAMERNADEAKSNLASLQGELETAQADRHSIAVKLELSESALQKSNAEVEERTKASQVAQRLLEKLDLQRKRQLFYFSAVGSGVGLISALLIQNGTLSINTDDAPAFRTAEVVEAQLGIEPGDTDGLNSRLGILLDNELALSERGGKLAELEQLAATRLAENVALANELKDARATLSAETKAREDAQAELERLVAAAPDEDLTAGKFEPFEIIEEFELGPKMVVLPGGTFDLGSPDHEEGRDEDEGPVTPVNVEPFALAQTEVTFAQYNACVRAGRCPTALYAEDTDYNGPKQPVVGVSLHDAQAYIDWLNEQTEGALYRLPSETEWEYAARARSTGPYPWGTEFDHGRANSSGTGGADRWEKTAPVGQFPSNEFPLFDMHGNVWEWTEDCRIDNYLGHRGTAEARLAEQGGDCSSRVVRGGSWDYTPWILRSANRYWFDPDVRSSNLGFRPARTLLPL